MNIQDFPIKKQNVETVFITVEWKNTVAMDVDVSLLKENEKYRICLSRLARSDAFKQLSSGFGNICECRKAAGGEEIPEMLE